MLPSCCRSTTVSSSKPQDNDFIEILEVSSMKGDWNFTPYAIICFTTRIGDISLYLVKQGKGMYVPVGQWGHHCY